MKKGFTLIECLVALLILAIVLSSASKSIGAAINDVKDSYTREAANWVANNAISEMAIHNSFPELGITSKDKNMASIPFIVTTEVTATPNPFFRKVSISVATKEQPKYILFNTINFISQY